MASFGRAALNNVINKQCNQRYTWNPTKLQTLGFLYYAYEKKYYWWELVRVPDAPTLSWPQLCCIRHNAATSVPRCLSPLRDWWCRWEVLEMGRKLFFSGIIIFISPGSPSQLVVGCIVAVSMMLISAYFMPYIGDTDDTLARAVAHPASLMLQLRTS